LIVGLWMSVAAAAGLRDSVNGPLMRIDAREPLLYCGAAVVLAVAAVLAMLGPARRGANADPLDALRCE
jgi:ABC-type antimicrobial peptide transport system permease subunit